MALPERQDTDNADGRQGTVSQMRRRDADGFGK